MKVFTMYIVFLWESHVWQNSYFSVITQNSINHSTCRIFLSSTNGFIGVIFFILLIVAVVRFVQACSDWVKPTVEQLDYLVGLLFRMPRRKD